MQQAICAQVVALNAALAASKTLKWYSISKVPPLYWPLRSTHSSILTKNLIALTLSFFTSRWSFRCRASSMRSNRIFKSSQNVSRQRLKVTNMQRTQAWPKRVYNMNRTSMIMFAMYVPRINRENGNLEWDIISIAGPQNKMRFIYNRWSICVTAEAAFGCIAALGPPHASQICIGAHDSQCAPIDCILPRRSIVLVARTGPAIVCGERHFS